MTDNEKLEKINFIKKIFIYTNKIIMSRRHADAEKATDVTVTLPVPRNVTIENVAAKRSVIQMFPHIE